MAESDRIEVEAPAGVGLPEWLTPDWTPCEDCRASGTLRWVEGNWTLSVRHDDGCPTLDQLVRIHRDQIAANAEQIAALRTRIKALEGANETRRSALRDLGLDG